MQNNTETATLPENFNAKEMSEVSSLLDEMEAYSVFMPYTPVDVTPQQAEQVRRNVNQEWTEPKLRTGNKNLDKVFANLLRDSFFTAHDYRFGRTWAKDGDERLSYRVIRVKVMDNGFLEISTRYDKYLEKRLVCLRLFNWFEKRDDYYAEMPIFNERMRPYVDAFIMPLDCGNMELTYSLLQQVNWMNKYTSYACRAHSMSGKEITAKMESNEAVVQLTISVIDNNFVMVTRQDGRRLKRHKCKTHKLSPWDVPWILARQLDSIRHDQLQPTDDDLRDSVRKHLSEHGISYTSSVTGENIYKTDGTLKTRCQVVCLSNGMVRFDCYLSGLTKEEKKRAGSLLWSTIRSDMNCSHLDSADSRTLRISSKEYVGVPKDMYMLVTYFQAECVDVFGKVVSQVK